MTLANQRSLFDIPDDIAYLNCSYMSPLPRASREAGQAGVARKSEPWKISAQDFFSESETARGLFAELIGGDPDGVAIVPSASYGVGLAEANLPIASGQTIVLLEDQFPSNVYPWRDLAARRGATIVTVARPADFDWTTAILAHINEQTGIVAVPHCHWTDGSLIDLARVGERARAVGAALVVDGAQSVGAHPFSVADIQPDFLVAVTYKWLLGPYSLGFVYVAPQWREGAPLESNWITREQSEDFNGLVNYRDAFQPGARRYDMGERSNFALMPIAVASLRQLLAWRVEEIAATLRELTAHIEDGARRVGLDPVPGERRVGHLIGLRSSAPLPPDLSKQLAAEGIYVSFRGNAIRVSPHLYNTHEEVDRLFAALAKAL
ncbi:MAG TPA: aminotransferase class V-fold PLP-dependent enzyme [Ktedonobacterales bacterium]